MYMQFMEPLGNTYGSEEASWDYDRDDWRKDLQKIYRAFQAEKAVQFLVTIGALYEMDIPALLNFLDQR